MLLAPRDLEQFFRLHRTLMFFVNQQLRVIPEPIATPERFSGLPPEVRLKVRDAWLENVELVESFASENPAQLADDELDIVRSWRHLVAGRFYVFRELKRYTVFMTTSDPAIAFGVVALSQPFEELIGSSLPILTETVLLPYQDQIVYDGLMNTFNLSFGPGIRRSLNESYKEAKARQGIVTTLPTSDTPLPPTTPRAKSARKPPSRSQQDSALPAILGLIDQFCAEHLNDEYAMLCRKLAETLARKRPSPLVRGQPNTWACGILRTIGWVNFLDDRSQTPHLKLTAIDKALGVGESTGQGKSKLIRNMLKIRQFDHRWTLPSKMEDNHAMWMLEINGFIQDVRRCPRAVQQAAFAKGLIPYIPADQSDNAELE